MGGKPGLNWFKAAALRKKAKLLIASSHLCYSSFMSGAGPRPVFSSVSNKAKGFSI